MPRSKSCSSLRATETALRPSKVDQQHCRLNKSATTYLTPRIEPHEMITVKVFAAEQEPSLARSILAINLVRVDLVLGLGRESRHIPVVVVTVPQVLARTVSRVKESDAALGKNAVGGIPVHALGLVDILAQVLARLADLARTVVNLSLVVFLVVKLDTPGARQRKSDEESRANCGELHVDGSS